MTLTIRSANEGSRVSLSVHSRSARGADHGGFNRRVGRKGIMTLTIRSANEGSRVSLSVHSRSVEEQIWGFQ